MFFNYRKMHSVTAILLVLKLPSFDTVVHNHYFTSIRSTDSGLEVLTVSCNNWVALVACIMVDMFIVFFSYFLV